VQAIQTREKVEVQITSFWSSALDGAKWPASRSVCFFSGIHLIRCSVRPTFGHGASKNRRICCSSLVTGLTALCRLLDCYTL